MSAETYEDFEYTLEGEDGHQPVEWGPLWEVLYKFDRWNMDRSGQAYHVVSRPASVTYTVVEYEEDGTRVVWASCKDHETALMVVAHLSDYEGVEACIE